MTTPQSEQLANLGWPWKSEDPAGAIILVSDEQFTNLAARPDEAVEKPAPWIEQPQSLRDFCRELAASGGTKIHIAYDYFFGGSGRGLYPDTPLFQDSLKKIHDVAREFGLGIEPSVLSPLELGLGYRQKTGESGRWMQYAEGMRDSLSGAYSVQLWKHIQWVNNKGPMPVRLVGARAFAFREEPIPGTVFFAVRPEEILELPAPQLEEFPGTDPVIYGAPEVANNPGRRFQACQVRAHGQSPLPASVPQAGEYTRVLVVLSYETVEMDYFSPSAAKFVIDLVEQYHDRGIELEGLYSDEMHIQQDWVYHHHFDHGQFTLRYVSPGFEQAFARRFGAQYADFARYLVYFTCHQHSFLATHEPKLPSQHAFGPTTEDIQSTLLFRRNYYQFLENSVVDLMNSGRQRLEALQGKPLDAFYHSTWAESPTCDAWAVNGVQRDWSPEEHRRKYEYTPDFIWSNTIQQASAACANYFAWNDFLTGGNNDVPEGGYADRNYYGRALACSLAALNRSPLASCGMWGMPPESSARMAAVSAAYGAGGLSIFRSVQDYAPRQVEVLFLYPLDLVAVEERFGSWMVQYGYANYISAAKLVEFGQVQDGGLVVKGQSYRTVCLLYEPFPSTALVDLLNRFVHHGGTLVRSSVPPQLRADGTPVQAAFEELFGLQLEPGYAPSGLALPGRSVRFSGQLAGVPDMPILTDFIVDRVFPCRPQEGVETVASLPAGGSSKPLCVGTRKTYPGGGQALYLGFRPRDDQSASTGQEVRTWFEILLRLGAYPGNDNPSVLSRQSDLLACAFPNGALSLAPHYRLHEETWRGGFFRDAAADLAALANNPVPGDLLDLQDLRLAGHTISYQGHHCLSFRLAPDGRLLAFAGLDCQGITLDGHSWHWSDQSVDIAWHPLAPDSQVGSFLPLYRLWMGAEGLARFPLGLPASAGLELRRGASAPGARKALIAARPEAIRVGFGAEAVPFRWIDGTIEVDVTPQLSAHWLYLVCRKD